MGQRVTYVVMSCYQGKPGAHGGEWKRRLDTVAQWRARGTQHLYAIQSDILLRLACFRQFHTRISVVRLDFDVNERF